jgi:hypothetical protein
VTTAGREDVEQIRTGFFRRTRPVVGVFYVVLALAAAALGASALSTDWEPAVAGILGGFALGLPLYLLSPRLPASPRTALSVIAGVAVAFAVFSPSVFGGLPDAAVTGGISGLLAATIVGIVNIRRRLARDDELLLRQKRLGWDPEHPWRWSRS